MTFWFVAIVHSPNEGDVLVHGHASIIGGSSPNVDSNSVWHVTRVTKLTFGNKLQHQQDGHQNEKPQRQKSIQELIKPLSRQIKLGSIYDTIRYSEGAAPARLEAGVWTVCNRCPPELELQS